MPIQPFLKHKVGGMACKSCDLPMEKQMREHDMWDTDTQIAHRIDRNMLNLRVNIRFTTFTKMAQR